MRHKIIALFLIAVLTVVLCTSCSHTGENAVTPEINNDIENEENNQKRAEGNEDAVTPEINNDTENEENNQKTVEGNEGVITLKFNSDFRYEKYDARQVKIRGYMSLLSPVDGKFIYLMNIPYQNCPFCIPNTTTIVNTIAIYAPNNKKFDFYDGPIEITGTLKVGDIVDEFGYTYSFKIIDAKYTKLDTSQLSENLKMYSSLSQDGIINDVIGITNKVDFNAFFELYDGTKDDISIVNSADFDSIINRINAISKTDYTDIISILEEFKAYNDIVNVNVETQEYSKNSTEEMEDKIVSLLNSLYAWLNEFEI